MKHAFSLFIAFCVLLVVSSLLFWRWAVVSSQQSEVLYDPLLNCCQLYPDGNALALGNTDSIISDLQTVYYVVRETTQDLEQLDYSEGITEEFTDKTITLPKSCPKFFEYIASINKDDFNELIQASTAIANLYTDCCSGLRTYIGEAGFVSIDTILTVATGKFHESGESKPGNYIPNDNYYIQLASDTFYVTSLEKSELKTRVLGWHRYTMNDTLYDYSLINTLSYYAYFIDPFTGKPKAGREEAIEGWFDSPVITKAKQAGCQIMLTAVNDASSDLKYFLAPSNMQSQRTFTSEAIAMLKQKNAQGLNISFRGLQKSDSQNFNAFIKNLKTSLASNGFILSIDIPSTDPNQVYLFSEIDKFVDFYVMLAYKYGQRDSNNFGGVSPFNKDESIPFNIAKWVKEHIKNGASKEKLLIETPYYGAAWNLLRSTVIKAAADSSAVDSTMVHSLTQTTDTSFYNNPHYKSIVPDYETNSLESSPILDTTSSTYYYTKAVHDSLDRQTWFDNAQTLGTKIDWVNEQELGGIAIWALGYDYGYDDLKAMLREKYQNQYWYAADTSILITMQAADASTSFWSTLWTTIVGIPANAVELIHDIFSYYPTPWVHPFLLGSAILLSLIGALLAYYLGFKVCGCPGVWPKQNILGYVLIGIAVMVLLLLGSYIYDNSIILSSTVTTEYLLLVFTMFAGLFLGMYIAKITGAGILKGNQDVP